jgi:hypothetical protein
MKTQLSNVSQYVRVRRCHSRSIPHSQKSTGRHSGSFVRGIRIFGGHHDGQISISECLVVIHHPCHVVQCKSMFRIDRWSFHNPLFGPCPELSGSFFVFGRKHIGVCRCWDNVPIVRFRIRTTCLTTNDHIGTWSFANDLYIALPLLLYTYIQYNRG